MAGQGQSGQSGSNKRADLRATVRKLRAARERLKQTSQQLRISKAAMEYGWGENDMPVVADRMIKALRDSIDNRIYAPSVIAGSHGKDSVDIDKLAINELFTVIYIAMLVLPGAMALGIVGLAISEEIYWPIAVAVAFVVSSILTSKNSPMPMITTRRNWKKRTWSFGSLGGKLTSTVPGSVPPIPGG